MQQLFLISDNDSLNFKWVSLCVWASMHVCLCLCGTNFSLVSQIAHGHRNPISIKRKKKNRFAFIIITDLLSLVHFDTVVTFNLLFTCLFVCVAQSALKLEVLILWKEVKNLQTERQRTAPAWKVRWSHTGLTCIHKLILGNLQQTCTVHTPSSKLPHSMPKSCLSQFLGYQWDMFPNNRSEKSLQWNNKIKLLLLSKLPSSLISQPLER